MTMQQPEALRLAHLLELDKWPDAAEELRRLHAENQELKEQMAAIGAGGVEPLRKRAAPAVLVVQEENHGEHLFDAVLNCPHSIAAESVTLHFCQKQKEGHNALSQLRHRLAAYDLAARQRELQLLGEIEALERLALNVLKQHVAEATPIAWYVTGCSTMLDEHDAKAEAKRCGGSAKAAPLYTRPAAGMDAETQRHASMGKAIERACMDLPDNTEVIVSLEKGAGTVTLIDQDGNEHENFSCDHGFAGVMNEAIDAALAAQAKQGGV